MHFGEHLTIDGYGGSRQLLNDEKLVLSCLTELCALVNMNPLSAPQVVFAPDNGKKDPGGWSGFIIIAESHISLHTFPLRRFLSADVYTCRNGLDTAVVIEFLRDRFDLTDTEVNFIERGKRYPTHKLD